MQHRFASDNPIPERNRIIPVVVPVLLNMRIGIDCADGLGISRALELTIPASEFEAFFSSLNGQAVTLWINCAAQVEMRCKP